MSDDIDVNEAAAAAKKLASSTNTVTGLGGGFYSASTSTTGQEWLTNPLYYYSQVPPPTAPTQWGYTNSSNSQLPGLNYSSFSNSNSSNANNAPVARNPEYKNKPNFNNQYQQSQQSSAGNNASSFNQNQPLTNPLYSNDVVKWGVSPTKGNYTPQQNQQQQQMDYSWNNTNSNTNYMNSNQNNNTLNLQNATGSGPKPVRFTLQGGKNKHKFTKPAQKNTGTSRFGPPIVDLTNDGETGSQGQNQGNQFNNQQQGFKFSQQQQFTGSSMLRPPSSNFGKSRFQPASNYSNTSNTSQVNKTSSYGLQSGSWASTTPTATTSSTSTTSTLSQSSSSSSLDVSILTNVEDWPPSLRQYSGRCYKAGKELGFADNVTEKLLGDAITKAFIAGDLSSKNWNNEPLPYQFSQLLRTKETGAIPGIITGKPIKPDEPGKFSFPQRGRGGGRGGRGTVGAGRGKRGGIRGRNRFSRSSSRSTSRSRSRSRSRSSSSSSSDSSASGRRRSKKAKKRGAKGKKKDYKIDKKKRKTKDGSSKRGKGRVPHIYSLHGGMHLDEQDTKKINARAARFAKDSPAQKKSMKSRLGGFFPKQPIVNWSLDTTPSTGFDDSQEWTKQTIVGTCTDLEKRFLRLTSAPDPSTVRPVSVLKDSLKLVRTKWRENEDYFYACDQLKSIRQDLTIQHVRDEFTIEVYETHARIALEKGDHEEFNQCQSQLCQLYKSMPESTHRIEFTAYRILYYIFTANTLDLGAVLNELTDDVKEDKYISHALALRSAWALQNYAKFFKLYTEAPGMASYLIDWFMKRERKNALKKITKAYRPNVPTEYVIDQLGLLTLDEWKKFLEATSLESAIVYLDAPLNTKINSKDTYAILSAL